MAKKPKKPHKLILGDEVYVATVLRVETFRADGRPDECSFLHDTDTAELSRDTSRNHFLIGYINEDCLKPNPETADPNGL